MERKQLESYRSMKREIQELNTLIRLGECNLQGKYYKKRIHALQKECNAIEKYVEDIEDSLIRRIFRMYYLEGKTQREIARLIHMDRSTVSRKLNTPAR
ncbi:MAG: helix-turn-helix domain-containing protein [Lachnospiraceae bacterium]|jgi:DNA-directed RNA polymerase specialized sigma subunit|nr:helix-turn-helix domain-containing protein [Lachnospiraceae bacterium]